MVNTSSTPTPTISPADDFILSEDYLDLIKEGSAGVPDDEHFASEYHNQ